MMMADVGLIFWKKSQRIKHQVRKRKFGTVFCFGAASDVQIAEPQVPP
jgi:hypothetical protein